MEGRMTSLHVGKGLSCGNWTRSLSRFIFHFVQEATAIFPLILLICGLFGTALAKWINKKLGGKVSSLREPVATYFLT